MISTPRQIEHNIHDTIVADVLGIRGGPIAAEKAIKFAVNAELGRMSRKSRANQEEVGALVRGLAIAARTARIDPRTVVFALAGALRSNVDILRSRYGTIARSAVAELIACADLLSLRGLRAIKETALVQHCDVADLNATIAAFESRPER